MNNKIETLIKEFKGLTNIEKGKFFEELSYELFDSNSYTHFISDYCKTKYENITFNRDVNRIDTAAPESGKKIYVDNECNRLYTKHYL